MRHFTRRALLTTVAAGLATISLSAALQVDAASTALKVTPSPVQQGALFNAQGCGVNAANDIWLIDSGPTNSTTYVIDASNVVDRCFNENFYAQDAGGHTLRLFMRGNVNSHNYDHPVQLTSATFDVTP